MNVKTILALLLSLLFAVPAVRAQQATVQRRSPIPFVFSEFKDAKVLQPFGRSVKAKANILLKNGALCYTENNKIMQAYTKNILGVEFDSVKYLKVDSAMGRVVYTKGYNHLLCVTTVDMKKYNEETYGGENLPYFQIDELNVFLELDRDVRDSDLGLPLQDKYYFSIMGEVIPANETSFKKHVRPEMKEAFNNLMHDKFWSWKDEKSLIQLFNYLD